VNLPVGAVLASWCVVACGVPEPTAWRVRQHLGGFVITLSGAQMSGPDQQVLPRDDSATDPAFAAFRARLEVAASAGDLDVLRRLMSDRIQTIDDSLTPDQLFELVKLRSGSRWTGLLSALAAGVAWEPQQGHFVAPYLAAANLDLQFVVAASRVRMRATPSTNGRVLRVVSHVVVDILDETGTGLGGPGGWCKVRTTSGVTGYVAAEFVKSPNDVRFIFRRQNGQWKLVAYGYGD
jgi:hypothetical protein